MIVDDLKFGRPVPILSASVTNSRDYPTTTDHSKIPLNGPQLNLCALALINSLISRVSQAITPPRHQALYPS